MTKLAGRIVRVAVNMLLAAAAVSTIAVAGAQAAQPDPTPFTWVGPDQVVQTSAATGNQIACTSTSTCVVVSGDGYGATFNPTSLGPPQAVPLDFTNFTTVALTCPSSDECLSIDSGGHGAMFSPGAATAAQISIDTYEGHVTDMSCPSVSECVTVDRQGVVWVVNPLSATQQDVIGLVDPPPTVPATPPPLTEVACPSAEGCLAFESANVFEFNTGSTSIVGIPYGTPNVTGNVSCVGVWGCLAPSGDDISQAGFTNGVTGFNDWGTGSIGASSPLVATACAAAYFCVAADSKGHVFEGDPLSHVWISSQAAPTEIENISCPSPQMCVGVAAQGRVYVGTPSNASGSSGSSGGASGSSGSSGGGSGSSGSSGGGSGGIGSGSSGSSGGGSGGIGSGSSGGSTSGAKPKPKHKPKARATLPTENWGLQTRPYEINFTGDGSGFLGGYIPQKSASKAEALRRKIGSLRWSLWTSTKGEASGAEWLDNCTPDCATGKFSPTSVNVAVYRPRAGVFTRMTIRPKKGRSVTLDAANRGGGYWEW